ncbi:hypothetical protein A3A76_00175 [Candidatus Woesebacteria bacterium RIFCSPLOWO2_01_FULL_39_23]|uniref:Aminoacyl-tRNA hydrolase n=1 Tax=Candidatus Woesebacteria bacterium RIFCSPHIGHO2_01_FULL_40_22 TaxID=1802499 RepID=A0A1F7YI89_9BACT|nr:MAG: hypothetical protein A2141_02965 [Candidatus Woesebacteria bacterium RBG_16_40_11]OGM26298.1 MAG: hypothetical protein A2628_03795 [Candidatus Woesebacteria bacterium RIFCSPHIGHO2_01_FULL_40_22]OGM35995.1 MAG: hypothetical protein A3E41_01020 [Candidatus Woesebacteria bacterium RIFCSPHIGHO2_12_FULL_38_9]OGM62853.1 MAG: hypothetical protein A3A76_00175 [Candidatus Woesebacteria bacterium RIFCSPLOWO2_01_FULL_39_23]
MKLIVGVGNPGVKYARTRFNAGFIIIDKIAQELANIFPRELRYEWKITGKYMLVVIKDDPLTVLVKPRTWVSEIGTVVRNLARFYLKKQKEENLSNEGESTLELDNLYVAVYDSTLKINDYKIDNKPFDHSEIAKISESLGDNTFWKIRVGVGGAGLLKKTSDGEFLLRELDDVEFAVLRHVADLVIEELDLRVVK